MTRLASLILLLCSAACAEMIAPVFPGTPGCDSVADCDDGWVCHRAEGAAGGVCVQSTGPRCGDGELRDDIAEGTAGHEACDDGNRLDRDACTNLCQWARCGDGNQRLDLGPGEDGYEACDDGNREDRDACSNDCVLAACGDGLLRQDLSEDEPGYEACDDGNSNTQDACTNSCTVARCGDGIQRSDVFAGNPAYEACDDGNEDDLDRCDADCQPTRCGDGIVQVLANEDCEDNNDVNDDACTNLCQWARCGDGILRRDLALNQEGFENCDDGNTDSGDRCPGNCRGGVVALVDCMNAKTTIVQMATPNLYYFGRVSGGEVRVMPTPDSQVPRQISCGQTPCILTEEGAVQCLPSMADPQAWEPPKSGTYTAIASGALHHCALDGAGQVWCWGWPLSGSVGIEPEEPPAEEPEPISEPTRVEGLTGILQIAAQSFSTCALDDQGVVQCWGSNTNGETGGASSSHSSPTVVEGLPPARQVIRAGKNSCALVTEEDEDAVYCWGNERQGLISFPLPPVDLLRIQWDQRAETGVIAQDTTGRFWRLTWVGDAQTGGGGYSEMPVPDDTLFVSTTSGPSACFLSPVEGVRCWGDNGEGELGQGTMQKHGRAVQTQSISGAVELALGRDHSCARLEDGTVRCWGSDELNQLGSAESTVQGSAPVTVTGINNAVQIVAGYEHSCARFDDGTASCWGNRGDPQKSRLGDGGASDGAVPVAIDSTSVRHLAAGWEFTLVLGHRDNGDSFVLGFGENTERVLHYMMANYSRPGFVADLPASQNLVAGRDHACAHLQTGEVRCWGYNGQFQLGLEQAGQHPPGEGHDWTDELAIDGLGPVAQVAAGKAHTCIRRLDGSVLCWGDMSFGRLGPEVTMPPSGSVPNLNAEEVVLGSFHACARIQGGEVHCWGRNHWGQLGDEGESSPAAHVPRPVVGIPPARQVFAGFDQSCVVTERDGEVWCWGKNWRNQLGNGHIQSSETPLAVQGRLGAAESP